MIVRVWRSPKSESRCESFALKMKRSCLTRLFSIAGLDLKSELNSLCLIAGTGRSRVYNLNPCWYFFEVDMGYFFEVDMGCGSGLLNLKPNLSVFFLLLESTETQFDLCLSSCKQWWSYRWAAAKLECRRRGVDDEGLGGCNNGRRWSGKGTKRVMGSGGARMLLRWVRRWWQGRRSRWRCR